MERESSFWAEPAGALVIVALFVGVGLGWAAWLEAEAAPAPYPPGAMAEDAPEPARIWLVDGFNLLHAAVLSGRERSEWWRRSSREKVLELAAALPEPGAEIWVVFDGDDPGDPEADAEVPVKQVFASSADEWLVRRVKALPRGQAVAVVTADRKLADRARHHGAEIVSPRAFAERCREVL